MGEYLNFKEEDATRKSRERYVEEARRINERPPAKELSEIQGIFERERLQHLKDWDYIDSKPRVLFSNPVNEAIQTYNLAEEGEDGEEEGKDEEQGDEEQDQDSEVDLGERKNWWDSLPDFEPDFDASKYDMPDDMDFADEPSDVLIDWEEDRI